MTKKKIADEDQPWTSNYPILQNWLRDRGMRCAWQVPQGTGYLEMWRTLSSGLEVIVIVHSHKHGWEVYVPASRENSVELTLRGADESLGIAS